MRWISRSRLSMQRLGFCKAVVTFSEQPRNSSQMADTLRARLEDEKHTVPYDEALAAWLRETNGEAASSTGVTVSLQKLYVYNHPSRTGWLSRLGFNEYVEYLPRSLGLVTSTYERTDMGLVLYQCLMSENQHGAFTRPIAVDPLALDRGEQEFFLYNLLAADGDFLLPFCDALISRFTNHDFNYLDAGSVVPDVMEQMESSFSGSIYTPADQRQLEALKKARQQILKNIEEEAHEHGSGSRREQTTIPRLEWLVDIGAAQLVTSRTWRFTQSGLTLSSWVRDYRTELKRRYPENALPAVLDARFFGPAGELYGKEALREPGQESFLSFISPSYEQLAGIGGYCLLRPLLLLSNIRSLKSNFGLFLEYDRAKELLEQVYQRDPNVLQYTIDRYNTDYQVKLERKAR